MQDMLHQYLILNFQPDLCHSCFVILDLTTPKPNKANAVITHAMMNKASV